MKHGGNDGQRRRSQSHGEVNRQKEGGEINEGEGESFARKEMLEMPHESPQEGKGGYDEERAEGKEKREFSGFEQQYGQVKRRHAEADDAADEAENEAHHALLPGQPVGVAVFVGGRRRKPMGGSGRVRRSGSSRELL